MFDRKDEISREDLEGAVRETLTGFPDDGFRGQRSVWRALLIVGFCLLVVLFFRKKVKRTDEPTIIEIATDLKNLSLFGLLKSGLFFWKANKV